MEPNQSNTGSAPASPSPALDPGAILASCFAGAIARAFPTLEGAADPLVAPSRAPAPPKNDKGNDKPNAKAQDFGDYQCNAAMPLAKRVGQKPQDVARAIVAQAATDPRIAQLCEPLTDASIAGPGFINIKLKPEALGALLLNLDRPDLATPPPAAPQTIVVDLMGVNLAKQMHVGHLRSPIIGDALARLFERQGHVVIRQNHVGDWGLPIAMVTARLMRQIDAGQLSLDTLTLDQLDTAYKAAQAECQRDTDGLAAVKKFELGPKALAELEEQVNGATEAFMRARQTLVDLQRKEPKTYAVWQRIAEVTMRECLAACKRLHINLTDAHSAGESSYADELAPLIADLTARYIAIEDQGALIVRLDEPARDAQGQLLWEPVKEPCLVRKSDGGYLYATTDIAAVKRRVQKFNAHRTVYAIDQRQNLHLRQVFASSIKAGYAIHKETGRPAILQHAAFGSVLGEDGKPFKTRSGESVKLADLLDETVDRATAKVREKNPDLAPDELARVAEAVGMAALKYADLSNDRARDYMFSFDRMLAFEGNTGPYLLYALVRIKSIFRKATERNVDLSSWRSAAFSIADPAEKTLALALLKYPATLLSASETNEPHRICQYLYDLAGAFASFFDRCPVLQADGSMRDTRLRLCDMTARVLEDGLHVLGIPTVDRM